MANMQLDFTKNQTTWYESRVPFHDASFMDDEDNIRRSLRINPYWVDHSSHYMGDSFYNVKGPLKAADYKQVDTHEVVDKQLHLTPLQREDLRQLISKFDTLFSGKIGHYTKRKFTIELKEGTIPYHCRQPYPIPMADRKVVQDEINRQVKLGLLEQVYDTEWGMPMFAKKKPNGTI